MTGLQAEGMRSAPRRLALCAVSLCLHALFSVPVRAQEDEMVFRHLSLEEGLSQSIVDAMIQDRKGFMWFVTEDGLNKYDGYGFEVFKHDAKDPESLIHNELKAIHQDRQGILWIGSFNRGLEAFDPSTKRFTHFAHDPADPASLTHDIVWALHEDASGTLWVGTGGGGLDALDRAKGSFTHYRHNPSDPASLSHDDVRVIFEDRSGILWIGTAGGGLNRFDPKAGTFLRYTNDPADPHSLSHNDVRALARDREGALWVGTAGGGLNRMDPVTGAFTRFRNDPRESRTLANDTVLALCVDRTGTLWVGTDGGGLHRFHPATGTFSRFRHDPNRPASLANDRIYSLLEDRSGILWVGTYGSGLSACNLSKKPFLHYRNDPRDPHSLSHDIVWSFCEDGAGNVWIGTHDGGLNKFDRGANRFTHYLNDPADPKSLSHNSVRMVMVDRGGMIWAATNGGGLNRLDPRTGMFQRFLHHPADPNSLSHNELRMVFQDREGAVWVGTYGGGLDRWNPGTGAFVHYRSGPDDPSTISSNYVRTAFEDSGGVLWFGTHGGGLNRFNRAEGTFTRYRNDPGNPSSLSNDFVFSIHEDRTGTLWVATYGGGLNRFDRKAGTFTAIRKADGLPDDAVYGILEDEEGRLWLSTNSGLSRYDPRTGAVRNYTVTDGLQSNEFNGGSYYRNPRGEMFFGGINGFNIFRPDRILDNAFQAPVLLTDFQVNYQKVPLGRMKDGRTLLTRALSDTDRVELSHRDQIILFEFASLHFAAPEKNRYAYKLEGLNPDWADLGTRRVVTFTTLPARSYVLRVKGTNSDGVWSPVEAALRIVVRPPWWFSSWAYGLYALGLIGIVLGLARFERKREREKGRLVEAELRTQAAELQSRTVEAEARALKVENERKSHELEGARKLQLSMLPKEVPRHPGFAIAARMETATEVGGDYYDFHAERDGTLTVALGDAIGHGTRAGIMVAVMKALFTRMRSEPDLGTFFTECDRTLYEIELGQMFMALTLLKIHEGEARVMAAAMPPLFIYRKSSGRVEQLALAGMFLGTELKLPYEEKRFALHPGDKVLLVSDGYLEQANTSDEMLDYERCRIAFQEEAARAPEEILARLFERFHAWCGGVPQVDDVTLVAIEVRD